MTQIKMAGKPVFTVPAKLSVLIVSKNMTNQTGQENTQSDTPEKASQEHGTINHGRGKDAQHSSSISPQSEPGGGRKKMGGKPVFLVPNKTIINFKSGFGPKLLCDDLTFTSGTTCQFSCAFCSVESTMRKHMPWLRKHGVTGDHMDIVVRRENAVEIARKQILSKPQSFRMEKKVIYASPLVDVAANMELVRETVEICKVILELTKWDIRLLSKSNLLPKVAEGLASYCGSYDAKQRVIYGVSTGTLDDKLAAAFEEGTALVSKRIQSLHWLQDNGFRTFGMICPSLPQNDYVKFAYDMETAIRSDKCEHVWAEVINVRGESFDRTYKALMDAGYDEEARMVAKVAYRPPHWENYARRTFLGHASIYGKTGKLRFLQYVNKANEDFWKANVEKGAVLL